MVGVWEIGLYAIQRLEKPGWRLGPKELVLYLGCSAIGAALLTQLSCMDEMAKLWLAVLNGSLLLACITDRKSYEVYRFVWWIAAIAGSLLVLEEITEIGKIGFIELLELVFFILIQEKGFSKLYGKADCHAFVVCALSEFGIGMRLWDYLMHMVFAVCILAVVQFGRHNVNRKGNLKHSVAFLPYITVSFWINVLLFFGKNDILIRI